MPLASFLYGKQRVRALVVRRGPEGVHAVHEITASVMLHGDFKDTYLTGDNGKVVATDTMKNTVQVLAYRHLHGELEDFALILARHFLERYQEVTRSEIEIVAQPWLRVATPDGPHAHTFEKDGAARPFCRAVLTRESSSLQSGIDGLVLLKSTGSAFTGYPRCEYTTLPETDDRIMATEMKATWTYRSTKDASSTVNARIRSTLVRAFAETFSPSVQNTLYLMGEAALAIAPEITEIQIAMPNKHYLPLNLKPFHIEENNVVFLPTDEPHGQIEGTVTRGVS